MGEPALSNTEVGRVLREMALLLELKGESPFRVKAYSKAARAIDLLEEEVSTIFRENRLREIKSIGEALADQITELLETGKLKLLEDLKSMVPPSHLEMLKIPSLGPKKIKALHDSLGIKTVGELEYACLENRLVELDGFGRKMQEKILQGIQQIKKYQGRYLYNEVIDTAKGILQKILTHPNAIRGSLAGSLRRRMEVIRNINLLASTHFPQDIFTAFSKLPEVDVVQFRDEMHSRYVLKSGVEVDFHAVSDRSFPFALYRLTGSSDHWDAMVQKAKSLGLELTAQGLYRGKRLIPCREEEGISDALGLAFIPPELREGQGEIEAAQSHQLPRLIEESDIRGVFHIHSSYSDGTRSVRSMAEAAKKMGFSYIGLSDHSQSARYAGGLSLEKLREQWNEIEKANSEMEGFHIFRGTESDILPDGSLDYDEDVLEEFDFVIISVHSHFNLPKEEMTQRVIKALRNPYATILAHPTGRLLLAREPYAIDMIQVIDEAAKTGVAIELNAHPFRLDIDWRLCKYAKGKGVKIIINPDAHSEVGLRDTFLGVGIGRKGWLEPGDILNALDREEMTRFLKERSPWKKKKPGKG